LESEQHETIQVSLSTEMIERIKRNSNLCKQSIDEYIENCIERYWDEFGYGVEYYDIK
jgi:hypothetical protein